MDQVGLGRAGRTRVRRVRTEPLARPTLWGVPREVAVLAQDTQGLNLRYHKLEVQNHWLIAITVFVVGVLLVVGAMFAFNAVTLSAQETTAQQTLVIADSGSTEGLDGVYTWSATLVDYNGSVHQGIDAIRQFIAGDQASGLDITSIGQPTTAGSIVSTPFTWSNAYGGSGDGILVAEVQEGKVVYATLTVAE
jgi:hypothetical protein